MMKRLEHIIILITLLVITAFSVSCDRFSSDDLSREISLKATLAPSMGVYYTKGSGEISSNYGDQLNISVARCDGETTDFTSSTILKADMGKPDSFGMRDISFDTYQGFPSASTTVNYVAWFPETSNEVLSDNKVTIPIDGSTDILYSDIVSGSMSSDFNTMTFRHALSKFSIYLYAMAPDEEGYTGSYDWGTITDIKLLNVKDQCTLILPNSSKKEISVEYSVNEQISSSFEINGEKGVGFSQITQIPTGFHNAIQAVYFLAAPPSANEDLTIQVVTTKDENSGLTISRNFEPGKHYKIYLRFTDHGVINADVVVDDWQNGETVNVENNSGIYYNLSEAQTANCYMITSPESYCFDATVKGNGYSGIAGIAGVMDKYGEDYYLLNPSYAEIVWTDLVDKEGSDINESFILKPNVVDGKVFFTVVANEDGTFKCKGNVLIGVKESPTSTEYLWTWHIWITDRPKEQGYKNGYTVMDRDLGATEYDPLSSQDKTINGLYWQWGRPTPFALDDHVYRPKVNPSSTEKSEIVSYEISDTQEQNMSARVTHPLSFYNKKIEGEFTKNLWGWRSEADEYAKTIYDPCPPGYRMPSIHLWRDLVMLSNAASTQFNAVMFNISVNNETIYYPMSGYFDEKIEQNQQGTGAYMWAATYDMGNGPEDHETHSPYSLAMTVNNGVVSSLLTPTQNPTYALPVRCISRMSKAHVTDLSDYQTANSYIISKDGYYKFKATIRGNGVGQLVQPGATSTIILTDELATVDMSDMKELMTVKPLWWQGKLDGASDSNTSSYPVEILNGGKLDPDGYVTFKVENFKEGNLILAAYDEREILWSWHLWLTDEPQMKKSNDFVVMDRNLGATAADLSSVKITETTVDDGSLLETYGLYFQGARKDPFPGPSAGNSGTTTSTWYYLGGSATEEKEKSSLYASTSKEKTIPHSVKNPMTFHKATDDVFSNEIPISSWGNVSGYKNADNQAMTTMLHPASRTSLWGYAAPMNYTGYGVTTTKTMYDPCPPGYIVAFYRVWASADRHGYEYYTLRDGGYKQHDGFNSNGGGVYMIGSGDFSYFDKNWFPFTGYIDGYDMEYKQQGSVGRFHTTTEWQTVLRTIFYNSSGSGQAVDENMGIPTSYAMPVRCQKE